MTNIEFLEKVYIRGLEGLIGDQYLERIITDDHSAEIEAMEDYMEAKNMAVQCYFKMKGWAL